MNGMIFNIQKFSLHDGPGIRTTIFFKGCPLSCVWCHNPESINPLSELMFKSEKCLDCNRCDDYKDSSRCPSEALETIGKTYNVKDIVNVIKSDQVFYNHSEGGVTFSGGEPLSQIDFLREVLKSCKDAGIHTTVDTSGFTSLDNIKSILEYVDLFLYDVKTMDDDIHKKYTGVSNNIILENLEYISKKKDVIIRVPLIKGVNDSKANIKNLCEFASKNKIERIDFLAYHSYSEHKYESLLKDISFCELEKPDENKFVEIEEICNSYGLKIKINK